MSGTSVSSRARSSVSASSPRRSAVLNLADAHGFQFELNPDVINEIAIVCAGDFQNVIYKAYCYLLRGEDIKGHVECFEIIPAAAPRAEREDVLTKTMATARDAERRYVEARLYRSLRRSDCIEPDSEQQESIALLLGEEDEKEFPGLECPT